MAAASSCTFKKKKSLLPSYEWSCVFCAFHSEALSSQQPLQPMRLELCEYCLCRDVKRGFWKAGFWSCCRSQCGNWRHLHLNDCRKKNPSGERAGWIIEVLHEVLDEVLQVHRVFSSNMMQYPAYLQEAFFPIIWDALYCGNEWKPSNSSSNTNTDFVLHSFSFGRTLSLNV